MTDDFQTFDRVMRARHSCRGFRPDPVPSTTIQQIVQTAQRVPTWCNAQPWQIIVTSGAQTDAFRNAMTQAAETQTAQPDLDWPQQYTGVYQERRRTCGLQLYQAVGVTRGDRVGSARQMSENYRLFGAPHVAIITSDSDLGPYGVMDCGGFVAAFAAAAQAAGVASIAQAAIAAFAPTVRAHFDIPQTRLILCAISFGYEDPAHPANQFRTERAPLSQVLDLRE